jgi:colanic acid biosynthesis glycosyl transferase WcaI
VISNKRTAVADRNAKKPSVVFFNRVYPPSRGATGRMLRDLARAFARDGWDVTVVTTGPEKRNERDGAVRVIRLSSRGKVNSIFSYAMIWAKMLVAGFVMPRRDLIVTMTDPPLLITVGRILARFKKSKHINWCQDLYPDLLPALGIKLPPPIMKFFKVTSRRSMKRCDRVIVIGRCMARYLTHSGMDPGRISVIPNWPDSELMSGAPEKKKAPPPDTPEGARSLEELFRDMEPKFRILYSGNLGRAHPVQTVMEAAALLAATNPEIEFVFVGDGPQFDRLAAERTRRGLENIRFLPYQPASRLRELMESGDLHLISMTARAAGLLVPCKLYSALAVGRPCILVGPEQSETARIIEDFHAGAVVPQGQAQKLAKIIREYRNSGDAWFAAHEGAARAGRLFVPEESFRVWLQRARDVANVQIRYNKKRA